MDNTEDKIREELAERYINMMSYDSEDYARVLRKSKGYFLREIVKLSAYASVYDPKVPIKKVLTLGDALLKPIISNKKLLEEIGEYIGISTGAAAILEGLQPARLKEDIRRTYTPASRKENLLALESLLSGDIDTDSKEAISRVISVVDKEYAAQDAMVSSLASHAKSYDLNSALEERTILEEEKKLYPTVDDYMSTTSDELLYDTAKLVKVGIDLGIKKNVNEKQVNTDSVEALLTYQNLGTVFANSFLFVTRYMRYRALKHAEVLYGKNAVDSYRDAHKLDHNKRLDLKLEQV
jgi:hypothetical protein